MGILGIIALLGIAFLLSNNKKKIDYMLVLWGLGLQLLFGIFILVTPFGKPIFSWFDKLIKKLLNAKAKIRWGISNKSIKKNVISIPKYCNRFVPMVCQ